MVYGILQGGRAEWPVLRETAPCRGGAGHMAGYMNNAEESGRMGYG